MGRSSGSSRRPAVSSSREPSMDADREQQQARSRTTDASPGGTFQRSLPRWSPQPQAGPGEHSSSDANNNSNRRPSSGGGRQSSSAVRNYESTLRGIQGLNFDGDDDRNNY